MKSWYTNRRTFLRGAGGIAIGLPLLDAMFTPEQARAQAVRRRFVLWNENNGNLESWGPKGGERNFTLGKLHGSLEPFREYLLLLGGLSNPGGPGSETNAVHAPGIGTIATGGRLTMGGRWGTEQQDLGPGKGISDPSSYSIDQRLCAEAEYQGSLAAQFQSYQFGVQVADIPAVAARVSYRYTKNPKKLKSGLPQQEGMHVESNPQRAFRDLFGALATGQDTPGGAGSAEEQVAAAKRRLAKRGSVLDYVKDGYTGLSLRVGTEDKARLTEHLELMRQLELQVASIPATISESASKVCGVPDEDSLPRGRACEEIDQGTSKGPKNTAGCTGDLFEPIGKAQMSLLVTAMKCDLIRVGTMQWSMAGNRVGFGHIGAGGDTHHDLAHSRDQRKLERIHSWYASMFAHFMGELQSVVEPDGKTLLDSTGIASVNELAVGADHSHKDIPLMLAGGAAGAFNTGRYLDFKGKNRTNLDVWLQVLHSYGVMDETFGDQTDGKKKQWLKGPLTEISS